ncbi:MAG: type II toxin-antitoxin system HicA family toxin [Chloroflexi bacterium]|nr:type II toxin-antitoxin system HicA family toxin [Chloroflexota bacterium]
MLKHRETGKRVTVPYHRKELAPKTLDRILKAAAIKPEDFAKLLR